MTDPESTGVQSGTVAHTIERLLDERNRWAERNGELHVLGHEMLHALEYLDCESDLLHKFRQRLHNVPQCRNPDAP